MGQERDLLFDCFNFQIYHLKIRLKFQRQNSVFGAILDICVRQADSGDPQGTKRVSLNPKHESELRREGIEDIEGRNNGY